MLDIPVADRLTIINADVIDGLKQLESSSIQCCVTSPPYYGLRSYLKADDLSKVCEIGSEKTPQAYVDRMVEVFREVKRVLRDDGVLWLNLGDSYVSKPYKAENPHSFQKASAGLKEAGVKVKDLLMIPARVALALQADGWYLRAACPWIKRNGMPESVKDRPAQTVEMIYMLAKSEQYFYDAEAVKIIAAQAGRKRADRFGDVKHTGETTMHSDGSVFTGADRRTRRSSDWFFESWQGTLQDNEGDPLAFVVNTKPYKGAHFACFPPDLIRPCIQSSVSEKGACPECGAPLKRQTKRKGEEVHTSGGDRESRMYVPNRVGNGNPRRPADVSPDVMTTGWQPSCSHAAHDAQTTEPCVVLDPFGGSGTTGQVALELGHRAVLIELNAEYIPLIRQRCGAVTG